MALKIENLYYKYPKNDISTLNGVDLTLKDGEITTLLGPNGAGKTTLIKSLTSNLKIEGKIDLNDKEIQSYSFDEKNKIFGYLPQENSKLSSLTVFEVILLGCLNNLRIKVKKEQLNHTADIIRQFNLEDISNKKYSELSGGQRRIVSIAQVLSKNPQVLILDEPTANLDVYNEIEVLSLIQNYVKKKNVACLLVLHSINLASRYSDTICLLKNGKVYKKGSPIEIITEANLLDVYHVIVEKSISNSGYPLIHIIENEKKKDYSF